MHMYHYFKGPIYKLLYRCHNEIIFRAFIHTKMSFSDVSCQTTTDDSSNGSGIVVQQMAHESSCT
jgi:hypothetical protein